MTFDLAQHQRERIRVLERENNGLQLENAKLVIALAAYIDRSYWKHKIEAMSQDEFMAELATTIPSRPEGVSVREVGSPPKSPSGRRLPVVGSDTATNHNGG
jgi:hypothetical protein